MNQEVIDAFVDSTRSVFKTMLDSDITPGDAAPCKCVVARGVSGVIGLTGQIAGDVIICFDEPLAIRATGVMLGQVPAELDDEVVDAVGELTNMIAGSAKGRLEKYDLSLALPTVILGSGHRVVFISGIQLITIPFESDMGSFSIELGLKEGRIPVCTC